MSRLTYILSALNIIKKDIDKANKKKTIEVTTICSYLILIRSRDLLGKVSNNKDNNIKLL